MGDCETDTSLNEPLELKSFEVSWLIFRTDERSLNMIKIQFDLIMKRDKIFEESLGVGPKFVLKLFAHLNEPKPKQ